MSTDAEYIINDPAASVDERLKAARVLACNSTPDLDRHCAIDLHLHSFYSDGQNSPAARVWEAWRRRMAAIAVCDHDTVDGQAELIEAGRIFGIDIIPSVEFYTDRPGVEILGYWPDTESFLSWLESGGGESVLAPLRCARAEQLETIIARIPEVMARYEFTADLTLEDRKQYLRGPLTALGEISIIMWQKYGAALSKRGLASNVKEFQAKFTANAEALFVPLKTDLDLSPTAFVQQLREWGALPGLAHPTELRAKEGLANAALEALIESLGAEGLRCLEVDGWRNGICPETGMPQTDLFMDMAQRYNERHPERPNLILTTGSDCHNEPWVDLEMGGGLQRNLRPGLATMAVVDALRVG